MISLKNTLCIAIFLGISTTVRSQYITIDESQTIEQLVEDVLINNSCANVSNISVSGLNFGSGNSYGYFSAGTSSFPFAEGLVITTGRASSAVGPNSGIISEGPTDWPGDADLEEALSVGNTINATVIEFDFLPLANKISFDYIFSSEQYLSNPSSNQCSYTDGFAFLLKQANTSDNYQNLAVIPNTNIPVKVNTVRGPGTICPAANEQYFDAFNGFDHPTNYNGQTVILTAEATVIPNTLYHIKLVVADQGNNLYDSAIFLGGGSFKVEKDLGPDRSFANNNPLCPGTTHTLDATEPGSNTYQWFQNGATIPGAVNPTLTVDEPGIYEVEITLGTSTCKSTGEVLIEYATLPTVTTPVSLTQCDANNDGIAVFNLTQLNTVITPSGGVTYFETMADAQNGSNQITNTSTYSNANTNQLVAKVMNSYGCSAFATVNLQVSNSAIPPQDPVQVCDSDGTPDGITTINLNQAVTPQVLNGLPSGLTVAYYASAADAEAQTNALPNQFTNTQSTQQVYARITNGADCFGIVAVTLIVNSFAPSGLANETVVICSGDSAVLQAPQGFVTYTWSNGDSDYTTTVNSAGTYSVTVTNSQGCSATKVFTVVSTELPVFVSADINDFSGAQNSVEINYTGNGDYTFSLEGINYQQSPVFTNLPTGEYAVYIKDSNCGIVGPYDIYVLDYPHFFTPNGDGVNDYWGITLPDGDTAGTVHIFDRYGKLLFYIANNSVLWDGRHNGYQLPATDYWFVLELVNGRTIKGHFSLIR